MQRLAAERDMRRQQLQARDTDPIEVSAGVYCPAGLAAMISTEGRETLRQVRLLLKREDRGHGTAVIEYGDPSLEIDQDRGVARLLVADGTKTVEINQDGFVTAV